MPFDIRTHFFAACAIGLVFSSPAHAALYLCNPVIKGDATAQGYEECIDINSVQDGVGRAIALGGGGGGRQVSAPNFSEITLTKQMDRASVPLRREAGVGKSMAWTIHFVSTGPEPCEYYTIELFDTLLSSHSMSSGGDRPSESLSLNFTKIRYTFYENSKAGTCGTPVSWCWDLAIQKEC